MSAMNIFLVGPRGSGKSTVGRMLAEDLSLDFRDTDALITEEAGKSVAEIVDAEGWPGFRLREALALGAALSHASGEALPPRTPPAGGVPPRPPHPENKALPCSQDEEGGAVIATGGGMVLSEANRAFMRMSGRVVYLRAPADVLRARLANKPEAGQRPPLSGNGGNPADDVEAVLAEREPLYRAAAHYIVEAVGSPREVAENIVNMVGLGDSVPQSPCQDSALDPQGA